MYVKEPKITKELGVGKDGYQTGGIDITIEATNPHTKLKLLQLEELEAMRADKKPVKAKWY